MEKLFDLPAHPLLVHAPVILVPLLSIAVVVLAARPAWRKRVGPWTFLVAIGTSLSFMLAFQSGEAFKTALERNPSFEADIQTHQNLAETTRLFLLGMVVALVVTYVLDWRTRRAGSGDDRPALAMSCVSAVLGVLATIWIIRTGHAGAKLVWEGII